MRTRLFTLAFPLVAHLVSQAQITINATDNVPAIGDTFIYNTAAFAAPPAGGADVLFDFSSLTSTATAEFDWIDTAAYSNGGAFGAQMAVANGPDTTFYSVTSAGLERMGEHNFMDLFGNEVTLEIVHSNSMLELALPITFGASWADQLQGEVTSDGSTGSRDGVIQGEADGYGHIQLPGGGAPIPVLRVKTDITEVIQIPIGGDPADVAHKRHQHDYYVPFLKMPILTSYVDSMSYLIFNVVESGIRYMSSEPVGLEEAFIMPMELGLMPNPAEGEVTVNMAVATGANAMLFVSDASGRVVASERLPMNTSRWQLDTGALAAGCYAVAVTDRTGAHGMARLVKR